MSTQVGATYQSAWLPDMGALDINLRHCERLAACGVVRELRRPRTFEALPEVIRRIKEDARQD